MPLRLPVQLERSSAAQQPHPKVSLDPVAPRPAE